MGNIVREILDSTGQTVRDVAVNSGVPKSTLYRYLAGEADPSWTVVHEIAMACNLTLQIALQPLSDPRAAQAAKYLLGAFTDAPNDEVMQWVERLKRRAPANDFEIIAQAGQASNPLHREGAHFFRGNVNSLTIASAGDITGKDWALSGAPVLDALNKESSNLPTLLWAEDAAGAAQALSKSCLPLPRFDGANVLVLPAIHNELDGATELSGVRIVSVLQGLLDVVDLSEEAREHVRQYMAETQ